MHHRIIKVLYVEEGIEQKLSSIMLEEAIAKASLSYQIPPTTFTVCHDAFAATEFLTASSFDVILASSNLSVLGPRDMFGFLKNAGCCVPMVYMTKRGTDIHMDKSTCKEYESIGFAGVLFKKFTALQILKAGYFYSNLNDELDMHPSTENSCETREMESNDSSAGSSDHLSTSNIGYGQGTHKLSSSPRQNVNTYGRPGLSSTELTFDVRATKRTKPCTRGSAISKPGKEKNIHEYSCGVANDGCLASTMIYEDDINSDIWVDEFEDIINTATI